MASLSLKHVYKVYGNGNKAVNDFTMEIRDKEFIVFVGPSGCGKSTTLRMIAGLEEISAGEIYIDGRIVNDVEPKDRDIAMVFQNYALYPHLSVYENMAFGLKIRRLPAEEIHRRVLEAAEILGITEYLAKKPKEMSGGQRQRVALGRAIVREPKVFLLDEPLSNLDAKLRTQMRAEISKLHARLETTFIYVTHDQTEAMTMGTRIVVMRGGYIQQIDTPRNLYRYPASKFVAGFIGTPQMNFLLVTLTKNGDSVQITFSATGQTISAPSRHVEKMRSEYLDGTRRVEMGIRAEKILSFPPEKAPEGLPSLPCAVTYVEELGDAALVYAELLSAGDSLTEEKQENEKGRSIVFRTNAERGAEIHRGDRMRVILPLDAAHFFDPESEMSLCPRIPTANLAPCTVKDGILRLYGREIPLPPALSALKEGDLTVEIPPSAIHADGAGEFTVEAVEEIGDGVLTHLRAPTGERVFVTAPCGEIGKRVDLTMDLERLTFFSAGERVQSAMAESGRLYGAVVRERVREAGKTVTRYCFDMAGKHYPIPEDLMDTLLKSAGVGVLKKRLRYEIAADAGSLGTRDEGIPARVVKSLDYGRTQYTLLDIGGSILPILAPPPQEKEVFLVPDLHRITYVDDAIDVILL